MQRRVRCSLPPHGVLCWPMSQLEASSAAQRRVRSSLPPQGVLCWPMSQLEPPGEAQRRVRCSLPPVRSATTRPSVRRATAKARAARGGVQRRCVYANAGSPACAWRSPNGRGLGPSCRVAVPTTESSRRSGPTINVRRHHRDFTSAHAGVWGEAAVYELCLGDSFLSLSSCASALSFSPNRYHRE